MQGERRDQRLREVERYAREQQEIRAWAENIDAESKAFDEESAAAMHVHHY
jgi:hypothetical protein